MRLSNVILGLALGGIATASVTAGCGDSSGGAGGSTGSTSSASTGGPACAPDSACTTVKSDCVAITDNKGKPTFALRMSQLDITKPAGLTKMLIKGVVAGAVEINLDKCNLAGSGTFNLLMAFDTAAKKLTVGGAHPLMDPTKGYTFVNQMIQGLTVGPITTPITLDGAGKFAPTGGVDIVLPIYLGIADKDPSVLLPLHKATIVGTLSADQNCIGKYNADKLDAKAGCAGTDTNPAFDTSQADLSGYMTLEEADSVVVSTIGQSLCVLISGDSATYGDGGSPTIKCKRDANKAIVFKGDWCDKTNMPAVVGTCEDSSALAGKLAASAVVNVP